MAYTQLPSNVLHVGDAVPCALRDKAGKLLLPRGTVLTSEAMIQQLQSRELYVDEADHEAIRRSMSGKLNAMVHKNVQLGRIADARPNAATHGDALTPDAPRRQEAPIDAWADLQARLSTLLNDPTQANFAQRLQREQANLLKLVNDSADIALFLQIYAASLEVPDYSVRHAVLVAVLCERVASGILGWSEEWRTALRSAALTMNIAMTAQQNQLALQVKPLVPMQQAQVKSHPQRGAQALREAGIQDELWLQVVAQHHAAPSGPLDALPAAAQLARLLQRMDIFAARISPRKQRPAVSVMASAKAIYLDENQQPDAAGSALIKAVGICPPGSLVRLASGEVGIVLQAGERPNEPKVAALTNSAGELLSSPSVRNTATPQHAVKGGVAPHEVKMRLNLEKLVQLIK